MNQQHDQDDIVVLVVSALAGKHEAFDALLAYYAPSVLRLCRRTRLFEVFTDDASVRLIQPKATGTPEEVYAAREVHDVIVSALNTLSEVNRDVVIGFCLRGYSYEDLAAVLNVPVSAIRGRLFHGRRHLRRALLPLVSDGHSAPQPFSHQESVQGAAGEYDNRCPIRQINNYVARLQQHDKRYELYRMDWGISCGRPRSGCGRPKPRSPSLRAIWERQSRSNTRNAYAKTLFRRCRAPVHISSGSVIGERRTSVLFHRSTGRTGTRSVEGADHGPIGYGELTP